MLGEPNPWLEVDAAGNITKLVNVTVHDDNGHTFVDDPFTASTPSASSTGTTISVDDIVYDHGANARFLANDLPAPRRPARPPARSGATSASSSSSRPGTT